jgi:hypothetical protein
VHRDRRSRVHDAADVLLAPGPHDVAEQPAPAELLIPGGSPAAVFCSFAATVSAPAMNAATPDCTRPPGSGVLQLVT